MRTRSENTSVVNGLKFCPDCGQNKPVSDFPTRKTGKIYAYCKPCNRARAVAWSARNKERKAETNAAWAKANVERIRQKQKEAHLLRTYSLTPDEVAAKLNRQEFMCAICHDGIDENTMVVDHCHETGKVRDLLCNRCNITIAPLEKAMDAQGSAIDRRGLLEKAIAYIERHRSGS